jgi:hypothetical protein
MAAKYTGLHSLRHFFASWCINQPQMGGLGLPPKVVQERMGHSSITMTMEVYGHGRFRCACGGRGEASIRRQCDMALYGAESILVTD